jgi:cell division protein FtsB
MRFEFQHASKVTKLVLIGEFLLVSYLLYALTNYIYKNYQVDYHIKNFQALNEKIASDNKRAADDLLYYSSDQYVEKVAKQNLGLVNPGEEVIIISQDLLNQPVNDSVSGSSPDKLSKYYNISNPRKWWKFFFEIDHAARQIEAPAPTIITTDGVNVTSN